MKVGTAFRQEVERESDTADGKGRYLLEKRQSQVEDVDQLIADIKKIRVLKKQLVTGTSRSIYGKYDTEEEEQWETQKEQLETEWRSKADAISQTYDKLFATTKKKSKKSKKKSKQVLERGNRTNDNDGIDPTPAKRR